MAGFDFGRIGGVVSKFMDTDYIDIKRDIDGRLQEVYSNVPCHLEMSSTDNPDPLTIDLKPIIQTITIHMNTWVDIQNNDFIVAKKMGMEGEILQVYSGRCGNPATDQGRKKVVMTMNATESEDPTPPPPLEPADILVEYKYGDSDIISPEEFSAEIGSPVTIPSAGIEGYQVSGYILDDGVFTIGNSVTIDEVQPEGHHIKFIYQVSSVIDSFRYLVDGLYTKDNGQLANGLHQYRKMPADVEQENDGYILVAENAKVYHEDSGKLLSLDVGQKVVLYPGEIFTEVSDVIFSENDSRSVRLSVYEPSEAELSSYITRWYDV